MFIGIIPRNGLSPLSVVSGHVTSRDDSTCGDDTSRLVTSRDRATFDDDMPRDAHDVTGRATTSD